jgi:hypothetical protein
MNQSRPDNFVVIENLKTYPDSNQVRTFWINFSDAGRLTQNSAPQYEAKGFLRMCSRGYYPAVVCEAG